MYGCEKQYQSPELVILSYSRSYRLLVKTYIFPTFGAGFLDLSAAWANLLSDKINVYAQEEITA